MRINHMRKNSVYKDPLVDDLNEKMEEYIKKLNYQPINDQLAEGILILTIANSLEHIKSRDLKSEVIKYMLKEAITELPENETKTPNLREMLKEKVGRLNLEKIKQIEKMQIEKMQIEIEQIEKNQIKKMQIEKNQIEKMQIEKEINLIKELRTSRFVELWGLKTQVTGEKDQPTTMEMQQMINNPVTILRESKIKIKEHPKEMKKAGISEEKLNEIDTSITKSIDTQKKLEEKLKDLKGEKQKEVIQEKGKKSEGEQTEKIIQERKEQPQGVKLPKL